MRERFAVFSTTGYRITMPYSRSGNLSTRKPPSTIWYVGDRFYCYSIVGTFRLKALAVAYAAALNAGIDPRSLRPKRRKPKPKTWTHDAGGTDGRRRWLKA